MTNSPYTEEQINFIRFHCNQMTAAELVELFNATFNDNRTKKGLQSFMQSKGLKCLKRKNTWADGFTSEQKEFMIQFAPTMTRKALTEAFNQHFGTSVCYNTIKGWCSRNKLSSPNGDGRFTTETSPRWQEGLTSEEFHAHFTDESFQNMVKPMREANVKHKIGDEVIRHGIPYIVINETFGKGFDSRLEKKSIYVWKQHHGEIPPNHIIIQLDRNPMNCQISNLRCIPTKYRALFYHNNWWNSPVAVKDTAIKWCELYYALKGATT